MARHGRREEIIDTLAGQALITPAQLQGPGIKVPRMPVPPPSVTGQIAAELGKWADSFLEETINKDNERSMMDGAIAATQGVAIEQLQLRGADKFALEGHRVLTAQTMSSQLQAAQVQLIEDSAFALGPDEYKAQLTEQLAVMTDGQDPATARMVREQLAGMLPELVGRQTLAYANFQEQQVYDAVVQAIPSMSSDVQGANALLDMATGAHPSADGLSKARRSQAIMEGIVLSFVNGNPRAFAIMKAGGVLGDMTTDQLNRITNAETQYQTQLRNEFSVERLALHEALEAERRSGQLEPNDYLNRYMTIEADFGIKTRYNDAKQAYGSAIDPANTAAKTRWLTSQTAIAMKDWKAFGAATVDLVIHAESGHDAVANIQGPVVLSGANKGDRAQSPLQVMPKTLANPGFGLRPSTGTDEDNFRLGEEYWAVMTAGLRHPSGLLNWALGDIEAAAIAYQSGFGNANKFIAAGRKYSVLPQPDVTGPYARAILKGYNDQRAPLAGDLHNIAVADAATVRNRVKADSYALAAAGMASEDKRWLDGEIDRDTWLGNRRDIMKTYGVEMTISLANAEIATTKAKIKAGEAFADEGAMRNITLEMHTVDLTLDAILDNPSTTLPEMQQALELYVLARDEIFLRNDVMVTDPRNTAGIKTAINRWGSVVAAHVTWSKEQAEIDFAERVGGVSDLLSPELQRRHFDQKSSARASDMQSQFDMSAQTEEDEAVFDASMNDGAFYDYKEGGMVDARSRAAESHIMTSNLIVENKEGKKVVNQQAVQSIERYVRFKEIAPELAQEFYSLEARTRAEAIIETAGPGGSLPDAAFIVGQREALTEVQRASMDAFLVAAQTEDEIKSAIDGMVEEQDLGILQAMFNSGADIRDVLNKLPSEEDAVNSPEVRALVRVGMDRWLRRLKLAMPGADAAVLVPMAAEELKRHSAFIGDTFVVTGTDLMQETFGGQAGLYTGTNVINNVIMNYLSSDKIQAERPELNDTSWTEFFPRWVQNIAANVAGVFTEDVRINRGASNRDFFEQKWRNLRKMTASVDVDGNIIVQIWNLNGVPGTPIQIPLREAGDLFQKNFPVTPDFQLSDRAIPRTIQRGASALNTLLNRGVRFE